METTLLYPDSSQFPFDAVTGQIILALKERDWRVPGILVEFDNRTWGYQMVQYLRGDDFKLWFGRPQRRLSREFNDTAAVSQITIPQKQLSVYHDESGPTYITYVGENWKRDAQRFIHGGFKTHSKLHHEKRWYLRYSGGCDCNQTRDASFPAIDFLMARSREEVSRLSHTHRGSRSPLLVHSSDMGREYDPRGKEPSVYRTDEVFAEFTTWLQDNLLARILAH